MSATSIATNSQQSRRVPITLTGTCVTAGFRSTLWDAANRSGMTVSEYVLTAAAEKLKASGRDVPEVFPTF